MWYLCGLGSNIDPEHNISKVLHRLMDEVKWLWVSEILETEPEGMQTTRYFLNALVVFWFSEKPEILKMKLNAIETELGRDRTDPERSRKDHTIDIDIIEWSDRPWFGGREIAEMYFRVLFENTEELKNAATIHFGKCTLGKRPVVICRYSDTADVVVEC